MRPMPDQIEMQPCEPVAGTIRPPGSKSITNRALIHGRALTAPRGQLLTTKADVIGTKLAAGAYAGGYSSGRDGLGAVG